MLSTLISVLEILNGFLHQCIVPFFLILVLAFMLLLYANRTFLYRIFSKISTKTWFILLLIVLGAFLIRTTIPPKTHVMFIDEPVYMEAGKELLEQGNTLTYAKGIAWPFMLAHVFFLFGLDNLVAIQATIIIGSLTTILAFLLVYAFFKDEAVALFGALVLALFQIHIRWSATAETNVFSLFFIMLFFVFLTIYEQKKTTNAFFCLLAMTGFIAVLTRIEAIILLPILLLALAMKRKRSHLLVFTVLSILLLPGLVQMLHFQLTYQQATVEPGDVPIEYIPGPGLFRWQSNFLENSINYGKYIFSTTFQPLPISVLLVIGIALSFMQPKYYLSYYLYFILLWIFFFMSIFHFFGGSPLLELKGRAFMMFYPAVILFVSQAMQTIASRSKDSSGKKGIITLIAILLMISSIAYIAEARTQLTGTPHVLKTIIPELAEKDIGNSCTIISVYPVTLTATTHLHVISMDDAGAIHQAFNTTDCVLFYDSYFCNDFGPDQAYFRSRCDAFLSHYDYARYQSYHFGNSTYSFKLLREKS